jgi:hypothetical protein
MYHCKIDTLASAPYGSLQKALSHLWRLIQTWHSVSSKTNVICRFDIGTVESCFAPHARAMRVLRK